MLTKRASVRILPEEPGFSTTKILRRLVDSGQRRAPQNGQYLRRTLLSRRAPHQSHPPRTARRCPMVQLFSPSLLWAAISVNSYADLLAIHLGVESEVEVIERAVDIISQRSPTRSGSPASPLGSTWTTPRFTARRSWPASPRFFGSAGGGSATRLTAETEVETALACTPSRLLIR